MIDFDEIGHLVDHRHVHHHANLDVHHDLHFHLYSYYDYHHLLHHHHLDYHHILLNWIKTMKMKNNFFQNLPPRPPSPRPRNGLREGGPERDGFSLTSSLTSPRISSGNRRYFIVLPRM